MAAGPVRRVRGATAWPTALHRVEAGFADLLADQVAAPLLRLQCLG
jgi:hypothetical protein